MIQAALAEDPSLPTWRSGGENAPRPVKAGFDVGLVMGGRIRWEVANSRASHVDARGGAGFVTAVGFSAFTGAEAAFEVSGPVHVLASLNAGLGNYGGPWLGPGFGIQDDPRGPFEFRAGVVVAFGAYATGFMPDVSATWMW